MDGPYLFQDFDTLGLRDITTLKLFNSPRVIILPLLDLTVEKSPEGILDGTLGILQLQVDY
jgi:hypothetical protein